MKIGTIEAGRGEKAFGFLKGAETHGGFAVHIPLHLVVGAQPGPRLVVQAGVSGLEIEPAMILPHVVAEVDPQALRGTLIVVPLMNTSGFEFEQVKTIWDDQDLNALGRGNAQGTVSEQMLDVYWREVLAKADGLIDIHTGALWGYFRYAGVYDTGAVAASQGLAAAVGLPQVVVGQPADRSMAYELAQTGKAVASAWIGGGPGLRDYREEDMERVRRAVLNGLKRLGMLAGAPEMEGAQQALRAHSVLKLAGRRGLVFMDKRLRGQAVAAGAELGYVKHPFSGDIVEVIRAPRGGVVVDGGASWPILPEDATLAILADAI
jgi:hypothetical protein